VEGAMPIIKTQATKAGLDVRAPSRDAIKRFIANLQDIERGFRPADRVAQNANRRLGWLRDAK